MKLILCKGKRKLKGKRCLYLVAKSGERKRYLSESLKNQIDSLCPSCFLVPLLCAKMAPRASFALWFPAGLANKKSRAGSEQGGVCVPLTSALPVIAGWLQETRVCFIDFDNGSFLLPLQACG